MNVENLDAARPARTSSTRLARDPRRQPPQPGHRGASRRSRTTTAPRDGAVTDATLTWSASSPRSTAAGGPTLRVPPDRPGRRQGRRRARRQHPRRLPVPDRPRARVRRPAGRDRDQRDRQRGRDPARRAADVQPGPRSTRPTRRSASSRKPLAGEFRWTRPDRVRDREPLQLQGRRRAAVRALPAARAQSSRSSATSRRRSCATSSRDAARGRPRRRVVVLGDLNDFEFSETLEILEGAALANLMETLPRARALLVRVRRQLADARPDPGHRGRC